MRQCEAIFLGYSNPADVNATYPVGKGKCSVYMQYAGAISYVFGFWMIFCILVASKSTQWSLSRENHCGRLLPREAESVKYK